MNPVQELNKVAKSVCRFNEKLATSIYEVAEEIHDMKFAQSSNDEKIVDKIDETSDMIEDIQDQLDDVIDELDSISDDAEDTSEKIAKKADAKSVGLFSEGETIVLTGSEFQGIYSGRSYLCGNEVQPGFIEVKELDGTLVGIFKKERFNLFTNAF